MQARRKLNWVIALICVQSLVASGQRVIEHQVSVPHQTGLRQAVDRRGHFTVITLAPGVHRLKPKSDGGGELLVKGSTIVIQGYGNSTVIDATGSGDRIFEVASNAVLVLSHIVLRGGQPVGSVGGAVLNNGTLILRNCVVTGSSSGAPLSGVGGDGGGIYNGGVLLMYDSFVTENACAAGGFGGDGGNGGGIFNSGRALISNCQIKANAAGQGGPPALYADLRAHNGGAGGGICNIGYLRIIDTVISGNRSGSGDIDLRVLFGGDGGGGAGIYNSGILKVARSTIATNIAGRGGTVNSGRSGNGGSGGGLFNFGEATVTNCTFSQNLAGRGGGGGPGLRPGEGNAGTGGAILNSASLRMLSCTICSNACDVGGTVRSAGSGGGIFNQPNAFAQIANTIIALNSASPAVTLPFPVDPPLVMPGGSGPDCEGAFQSGGFNLIGIDDGTGGLTNVTSTDMVGNSAQPIDPLVGPLQANGGPTPTHALLSGSPAIDHGKRFGLTTDQRGRRRTKDNRTIANADGGDGTDIGAIEVQ